MIGLRDLLRRHGAAAGASLVLALAVLRPMWPSGEIFCYRDLLVYSLPMRIFARQALLAGEMPWRNPYVACGNPFLGNPETQLFYPPAWGYLLGGLWVGGWIFYASQVAVGVLGANLLARRLGVAPWASVAAGIAFGASGVLSSELEVQNVLCDRLVPLVLWAALGAREAPGARGVLLLAMLQAVLFFGGEPSTFAATVAVVMAILLWPPGIRGRALRAAGAAVVWIPLAACQLVPFLRYVVETERVQGLAGADVVQWALTPWELLETVYPALLVSAFPGKHLDAQTYLATVYLGVAGLLAVLARVALGGWRRCEIVIAAAAVPFLLLAAGGGPLPSEVYRAATLGVVRYPVRFMTFVSLAVSLLVGFALERLWERRTAALAGIGVAGVLVMAAGFAVGGLVPELAPRGREGAWRAGLAATGLALSLAWRGRGGQLLALGVLATDLLTAPPRDHLVTMQASALESPVCDPAWSLELDAGQYRVLPMLPPQVVLDRVLRLPPAEQPAELVRWPFGLSLMPCGIRSAAVEPVLPLAAYDAWLRSHPKMLARASVRFALLPGPTPAEMRVVKVPARPRVSLARAGHPEAGGVAALARQLAELPLDEVTIAGERGDVTFAGGRLRLLEDRAHAIQLQAEADGIALVVITERWDEGWSATVSAGMEGSRAGAVPTRMERVDGQMTGIRIPPGASTVLLRYREPWGVPALVLSALSWVAGFAVVLRPRSGRLSA